jgi:hypothetical protein
MTRLEVLVSQQDNCDRLLAHLKDSPLAAQLVRAYRNPGGVTPTAALKIVIRERLKQVRSKLDPPED